LWQTFVNVQVTVVTSKSRTAETQVASCKSYRRWCILINNYQTITHNV
jgi:hypothetical protein